MRSPAWPSVLVLPSGTFSIFDFGAAAAKALWPACGRRGTFQLTAFFLNNVSIYEVITYQSMYSYYACYSWLFKLVMFPREVPPLRLGSVLGLLAMHSLTAASRPRLSETEPKWFVFETS